MKDTTRRLEGSLNAFGEALAAIAQSLFGWLKDDVLRTPLLLVDDETTWKVCDEITGLSQDVVDIMEVIQEADNDYYDDLETAYRDYDPDYSRKVWLTAGPMFYDSPVHENLTDLVKAIVMAGRETSAFLDRKSAAILESGWSEDSPRWAQEQVDSKVSLLREKSEQLTLVVSDLIDPRGQQMALLVDRIESHLKELKSRIAIAANQ